MLLFEKLSETFRHDLGLDVSDLGVERDVELQAFRARGLRVAELTVDAVRVALERERMVARVGKKDGRDTRVVVDDLTFGEPDLWIQDLFQVRELQGAALDLNIDRRFFSHLRAPHPWLPC